MSRWLSCDELLPSPHTPSNSSSFLFFLDSSLEY
uniref:Uncharacterized protein n=1 Tax=Zea mays TaxID=4577 RepID=B4FPZ4_MAIZE|nr:unknown [Zea mays]